MWQSVAVDKFERPLMTVALGFMGVMALVGWYTVFRVGFDPAVLISAIIGSAAVGFGLFGWIRGSAYYVAGGALGAGLLFPTVLGYAPMVLGFILFVLLISLRMFNQILGDR